MDPILAFSLFAVLFIAGLVFNYYQKQQRWKFWEKLADDWDYRFRTDDAYHFAEREEFPLFRQGGERRVDYLIEGKCLGRQLLLFDYAYVTGSGKSKTTHSLTALMIETPVFGRGLTVRPENFFDRIAAFMGFDDINFEFEEFNRAFQVKCNDKKFAYDVFHNDMMEFLMQHRDLAIEWFDFRILLYLFPSQHVHTKAGAERMRGIAEGIVKRLPEYLVEQQREA